MEVWHIPYESVMAMPSTRRYRLWDRKIELERDRAREIEAAKHRK